MALLQSDARRPCPKPWESQSTGKCTESGAAELWKGAATKVGMLCTWTEKKRQIVMHVERISDAGG